MICRWLQGNGYWEPKGRASVLRTLKCKNGKRSPPAAQKSGLIQEKESSTPTSALPAERRRTGSAGLGRGRERVGEQW